MSRRGGQYFSRGRLLAVSALCGALIAAGGARAADVFSPPAPNASGEDWFVTIGASGRLVPSYPGSDDYTVRPGAIFSVAKASQLNVFRSVDDNPSLAFFDTGTFRVGAVGRLDWGRDQDDSSHLRGLGDVSMSVELGGFAEWYVVDWLRVRGELRYGFGGYEGFVGDLAADIIVPFSERWRLAVGPRLSFASQGYMDAYFGVDPLQSARATLLGNPLGVYQPSSGIESWGATAQLTKNFGNGFEAGVYGSYYQLVGDAASSPLTTNENQFVAGLSLSYTFNIGKSWW